MRVDFLLVLFLETKYDLDRDGSLFRTLDLQRRIDRD